jgi:N-acetyltransferase
MQIDLGGDIRKLCKTCGMDYVLSNEEDIALHKKFHEMNVGGVDLGKAYAKGNDASAKFLEAGAFGGESDARIMAVNSRSSIKDRNAARRVLDVVFKELGSSEISDSQLWGQLPNNNNNNSSAAVELADNKLSAESAEDATEVMPPKNDSAQLSTTQKCQPRDRFQAFLYMRAQKCVGLCLAERISTAHKVVRTTAGGTGLVSSSISIHKESGPAILGISRIWTSNSCRRQGIASVLLECVRKQFIYGVDVPRSMMAFSQPTESGGRLARNWFGTGLDFRVYIEE